MLPTNRNRKANMMKTKPNGFVELVDPTTTALLIGVHRNTLITWHKRNFGPRRMKMGNHLVRYRLTEVRDFVNKL